jgi:hypothetical protein
MIFVLTILSFLLSALIGEVSKALPYGLNQVGFGQIGDIMQLSWNEKRARAAKFADEWRAAGYERGESQSFYNDFFNIFGIKRRRVASFE